MIVACPSCQARFNLDSAKLLPAGRNVRCAKCGHRWRQMPEGFEEQAAPLEEAAPPPAPAAEPAAESFAAPEPEPQPAAESLAAVAPEEIESHEPTPPETPAEMAQSLAAIAEQVAGARGEGYSATEGSPQATPQNPISRLARRTAGGPGPITVPPRMRPMRPAKRSSHLGLLLIAGLVIGLLIAAFVFRDVIARTVPGADVIYSLLHLSSDNPGDSLDISVDDFDLNTDEKTGQRALDLKATVFNHSEHPINMPALMVIPVDDAGSQLEPLRFRLKELVLEPGQNIKFQISFANWPATATGATVDIADMP